MSLKNRFARFISVAVSATLFLVSLTSTSATAVSNPKGLFGASDPTYDGVFRQSIAIMALVAADAQVPVTAINWLANQQCPNGGFEAFRIDPNSECQPSNPETYSGIDTNSTALAAVALALVGKTYRAEKAVEWLKTAQRGSGGLPYFKGGVPDSASTALALIAAKSVNQDQTDFEVNGKNLVSYLRTTMLDCNSAANVQGALAYQKSNPLYASPMTTSQALAALSGAIDSPVAGKIKPATMNCEAKPKPTKLEDIRNANAAYLTQTLAANNGVMPSEYGSGDDWGSTAWAVIGLAGSGYASATYGAAIASLKKNLQTALAYSDSQVNPGRAGLIIMAAEAAGLNSKKFESKNLVSELKGTLN